MALLCTLRPRSSIWEIWDSWFKGGEEEEHKFVDTEDKYLDGDYFKEFAHYTYLNPGNFRDVKQISYKTVS